MPIPCQSLFGIRTRAARFALAVLAVPAGAAADGPAGDNSAALALGPRSHLPPAASDPLRPPHTRLLKGNIWTDDAGVDDFGNLYNQYKRASVGTWSNYDEAKANPFPIPDPLVLNDGSPVTDAATWWGRRRPEILDAFATDVYGRIPARTPAVTWTVASDTAAGGVRTKTIVGRIDNSAFPAAAPEIDLTLSLPAGAAGPVPVMVVVAGGGGARRPVGRSAGPAAPLPVPARPAGPTPLEQVLARGWGYAVFSTGSVQADSEAGLNRGIIGLMDRGRPRSDPAAWGTLTAWTWGLSRSIDYFETDPQVDAKHLGVEGHSRWGKTALWAAASDPRWAIVFASCSGEGGAKLFRRNFGETTDNIAGSSWMAANFRKYAGHWNDLPVDSNELIALVAPRPAFITGATQDPWSDPHGEFLAAVGAGPVYRLLGKRDLGATALPAPNVALISGELGFREHIGPHTDLPDWPAFLEFAAKYFPAQR
jgi:hypothetical protein